jgi:hypothetical protein
VDLGLGGLGKAFFRLIGQIVLAISVADLGSSRQEGGGDKKRRRGDKGGRRSKSREGRECRGVSKGRCLFVSLSLSFDQ